MKKLRLSLCVLIAGGQSSPLAAAAIKDASNPQRIPGQYIAVLKPDPQVTNNAAAFVSSEALRIAFRYGVQVRAQFSAGLAGLAVRADESQIAALAEDSSIAYIEANKPVYAQAVQENVPSWGLDRIDARSGFDGSYTYQASGKGVHAYVIDSGLRASHREFAARVGEGFSALDDAFGTEDCYGHGTHVSGILGGSSFGVAKEVTLHPVRILNCEAQGTIEDALRGIDWVIQNAQMPALINFSISGEPSAALEEEVRAAIKRGILFVVAAGNYFWEACQYAPANVAEALTVGATKRDDYKAGFSNYGSCVDLFAPGDEILSAWINNDKGAAWVSGTSMAAPHAAGVAALLLERDPTLTPAQVIEKLKQTATPDKIFYPGLASPNLLLFTGEVRP